jgi:hypothetical protein
MDFEFEKEWREAIRPFVDRFGEDLDLDTVVFLIGVQELGHGFKKFSKDEKLDVIHVGVCTLLEPYGYYSFEGKDNEGWPHFERKEKLPHLSEDDQERLMKEAIINYIRTQQPFSA